MDHEVGHAVGCAAGTEAVTDLAPRFSHPRVRAAMSGREGGVSAVPFNSLNLAVHVGDDLAHVAENRRRFAQSSGLSLVRLQQVHGAEVVTLHGPRDDVPRADGAATARTGVGCEVQVADCLPVLFAHRGGRAVAAAHAGWRGLAQGVLEAALLRCCQLADAPPSEVEAWLGPCIGPAHFEVGIDVPLALGCDPAAGESVRFKPRRDVAGKWWADLPGLARDRLVRAGVTPAHLGGNDGTAPWCTVQQPSRFFSFRRDGRTGRHSAVIGLLP